MQYTGTCGDSPEQEKFKMPSFTNRQSAFVNNTTGNFGRRFLADSSRRAIDDPTRQAAQLQSRLTSRRPPMFGASRRPVRSAMFRNRRPAANINAANNSPRLNVFSKLQGAIQGGLRGRQPLRRRTPAVARLGIDRSQQQRLGANLNSGTRIPRARAFRRGV